MGLHSVGHRRGQGEWTDLLGPITRNQRDGGLQVRHHPLSCFDPLQAGLTATLMRGHTAPGVQLCLDIGRHAPTVAPHAALPINKVSDLGDRTEALGDRRALGPEALALLARAWRVLGELLLACGGLWRVTRPLFCRHVACALTWPLHVRKPLGRLAGRLRRRPLLGGQGAADGLPQRRRHRAEVRRGVRAEVLLHVSQPAWGCSAGRWDALTVATRPGLLPKRLPRVVSAGVGRLLSNDGVALGGRRPQAQAAGTRVLLGQRHGFGGHVLGQTCAFLVALRHARLLPLTVPLGLRPIRGRDQAIQARECAQQTPQAQTTGTHCGTHQGSPEHQTREAGTSRGAGEKGHDGGRFVTTCLLRPPSLQGAARNLPCLGGLPPREPVDWQSARRVEAVSTWGAMPAWGAISMAWCCGWDDGSHGDLRVLILRLCIDRAKDGEVAYAFQPCTGGEALLLCDSLVG